MRCFASLQENTGLYSCWKFRELAFGDSSMKEWSTTPFVNYNILLTWLWNECIFIVFDLSDDTQAPSPLNIYAIVKLLFTLTFACFSSLMTLPCFLDLWELFFDAGDKPSDLCPAALYFEMCLCIIATVYSQIILDLHSALQSFPGLKACLWSVWSMEVKPSKRVSSWRVTVSSELIRGTFATCALNSKPRPALHWCSYMNPLFNIGLMGSNPYSQELFRCFPLLVGPTECHAVLFAPSQS